MATTKKKKPAAKSKVKAKAKSKAKPQAKPTAKKSLVMKKTSSATPKVSSAKITFRPLNDRLLVSIEAAETKTAGGIIIPGTAAEKPFRGRVLAKGPGRRNKKGALRPLDVSVGDMIVFPQYAGTKIEISGDEFLILREEEILAITVA